MENGWNLILDQTSSIFVKEVDQSLGIGLSLATVLLSLESVCD